MSEKYILEGRTPVLTDDLMAWARIFEGPGRIVAKTVLDGNVTVSTVFLGLNHRFGPGTPLLFETMIFGGEQDDYCDRYSTWDQAEAGHAKAIRIANNEEEEEDR